MMDLIADLFEKKRYEQLGNGQLILSQGQGKWRRYRKNRRQARTSFPSKLVTKGAMGRRNGRTKASVTVTFITWPGRFGPDFPIKVPVQIRNRPEAWKPAYRG